MPSPGIGLWRNGFHAMNFLHWKSPAATTRTPEYSVSLYFAGTNRGVHLSSLTLGAVDIYLSAGDCEEFFVLTRRGEEE